MATDIMLRDKDEVMRF